MSIKSLMVGALLAVMILAAAGGVLDISSPTFFTLYGKVSDGIGPVNGAQVSLTVNGVTQTTLTAANARGEAGYYQFNLANFPTAPAGTILTLEAKAASIPGKSAFLTVPRAAADPQRQDLTLTTSGTGLGLSVDAQARSTVVGVTPATYVLTVTNPGNDPETYTLTIQNPQNAIASLDTSTITLDGHTSGTVLLYVTAATEGSYVVNVTATYPNPPAETKTVSTTTTVYSGGKITGSGGIPSASFDIAGQYPNNNGVAQGSINYKDNSAELKIKSIQITSVGTTTNKKGMITGHAQVNGAGSYYFEVYVEDNGESGKGQDVFWIYLPTYPYSNSAVLSSGNIQIYK